jgi:hypothetical protein
MRFRSGFGWVGLCVLLTGCDQTPLTAPSIQAASSAGSGPAVPAPSLASAVAVSTSQLDVAWQDNASNELGFEVHRSSSPSGVFSVRLSTGPNVTSFRDGGLSAATQSCYKIRALRKTGNNTGYSAFSNTACATTLSPPPPPNAPSDLGVAPAASTQMWVWWTDNSANEDGFRIERSIDAGASWIATATSGPNQGMLTDYGLTPEQEVCYRVIAFNAGGDSPPSNSDCTTPPAGPTHLDITGVDSTTGLVILTWEDNSAVEDGYDVVVCFEDCTTFDVLPPNSTTYETDCSGGSLHVVARKDYGYSDGSNSLNPSWHPLCGGDGWGPAGASTSKRGAP